MGAATMDRLSRARCPANWSDRAAWRFAAGGAEISATNRARATPSESGTARRARPAVRMTNELGIVFAKLDCKPRCASASRARDPGAGGARSPRSFFLSATVKRSREIPGARLLVLKEAATAIPDAAAGEVATAMLAL